MLVGCNEKLRKTSKESRKKEMIKGKKSSVNLKRKLILYPTFGTLKQQKIKIKANKEKSKHRLNQEALHFCMES